MITLTMQLPNERSVIVTGEFEEDAVEALLKALGGTFGILEDLLDEGAGALSPYPGKQISCGLRDTFTITIYDHVQNVLFRKKIFSQLS